MTATATQMTDSDLAALGVQVIRDEDGADYLLDGITVTERDHGGWLVLYGYALVLAADGKWVDATAARLEAEGDDDEITWADRDAAIRTALASL